MNSQTSLIKFSILVPKQGKDTKEEKPQKKSYCLKSDSGVDSDKDEQEYVDNEFGQD